MVIIYPYIHKAGIDIVWAFLSLNFAKLHPRKVIYKTIKKYQ